MSDCRHIGLSYIVTATIPFFFTFLLNCTGPGFYFSSIFTNFKTPKTFKTLKILKFKN